jgi:hypothetical protein
MHSEVSVMGIIKAGLCAVLLGGTVTTGYFWGTAAADCHPYRVEQEGGVYLLRDKKAGTARQIFAGPVVGTLQQRLDDVMADAKGMPDKFWVELRQSHDRNYAPR